MKKNKTPRIEAEQLTLGSLPTIDVPKLADAKAQELATQDLMKTQELGLAIIQKTAVVNDAYFKLCSHLRTAKSTISTEAHRKVLYDLGYNKARVSEILRVSQAPDDVWSEYNARLIGFNRALEAVRGTKPTPAGLLMLNTQDLKEAKQAQTPEPTKPAIETEAEPEPKAEPEQKPESAAEEMTKNKDKFNKLLEQISLLAPKVITSPCSVTLNGIQIDIYSAK